jgi:hypothetical protein
MLSMVYPADATPGHLLSVVPETQLAQLREMEERLDKAKTKALSAPLVVYQPPQADLIPSRLLRNKSPLVKTKQSNDSSKREHRTPPPQLPPIAPPAIPLGGWPPASPAIIDTNKPHQIFKNWLKR